VADGDPIASNRRPRRPRRSSEEIVGRIIAAATEEFEVNGYAGATTASIARKAGVAEPLIFTNFGSKSKLFHASIFTPLNEHLIDFFERYNQSAKDSPDFREKMRRTYIEELRDFIERHSRKFVSLFFAQTYGDAGNKLDDIAGIQDYLNAASSLELRNLQDTPRIDPRIMAGISFSAIFSCVIFREWVFPHGTADKDEVYTALIDFVIDGLNANKACVTTIDRSRS
jgi:AcrR family transcriptional regulator